MLDLIQDHREALNLVHHYPPRWRCLNLAREKVGLPAEPQDVSAANQVKPAGIRKDLTEPGGLAGPSGSKEEERSGGKLEPARK